MSIHGNRLQIVQWGSGQYRALEIDRVDWTESMPSIIRAPAYETNTYHFISLYIYFFIHYTFIGAFYFSSTFKSQAAGLYQFDIYFSCISSFFGAGAVT